MKKIIKNKDILKYSFFFILGAILFGSAGVLASSYILKSSDIEYKANKSVQEAVEELYAMYDNESTGSNQTLPIESATVIYGTQVNITYTGTYKDIKCLYGTNENYGSEAVISNNICTFTGNPNTKYYYKLIATNNDGKIYEASGNKTTEEGTNVVLNDLPTGVKAIIYLDPTDITKVCNEQNSTSTTGTKSGCMKWYAYKETNDSYTMILDHNTTATVNSWSAASTKLASDTTGWTGSPRLITGQEVADITGISWTSSGSSVSFKGSNTPSDYYWLYDYTNCGGYGCNIADSSTNGYWTSTSKSSSHAWNVYCTGTLYFNSVSNTHYGVRPVIEVSKSNL